MEPPGPGRKALPCSAIPPGEEAWHGVCSDLRHAVRPGEESDMLKDAGTAILGDLRFALRSLRRSPAFTLIAIITLGLGIGANTSAFSILNGVLLQPLPYPDVDHLDRIYRATAQDSRGGFSPADYLDLKSQM